MPAEGEPDIKAGLRLDPVGRPAALAFLARHEKGTTFRASLYLGAFWLDELHGILAFGQPVANGAAWCLGLRNRDVLELGRMILDDIPPRNTESRALAVSARLIARRYSHLRALLTYCRDEEPATAYHAAGWRVVDVSRSVSAVEVNGIVTTPRSFRRMYGVDAEKRVPHRRIVRPTQKLALGLDEATRSKIEELAASLAPK